MTTKTGEVNRRFMIGDEVKFKVKSFTSSIEVKTASCLENK